MKIRISYLLLALTLLTPAVDAAPAKKKKASAKTPPPAAATDAAPAADAGAGNAAPADQAAGNAQGGGQGAEAQPAQKGAVGAGTGGATKLDTNAKGKAAPSTNDKAGGPMDVTIKGQAKDKVMIERVLPPTDVAMKDAIPFSRLGQTDWILSEELGYLDEEKQVALMDVHSPKTYMPSMIEFPKPPFFVQAYPPPPQPVVVDRSPNAPPPPGENETWTFIVVDQNNQLLKKIEGNTVPPEPIQWDGMTQGEFMLRTDEIYSSMLVIQDGDATRTIVGDPIWLPALRYVKGNTIIFEFSNKRVYGDGQSTFTPALRVLVDQLLNELRRYEGTPFEIVIYDRDLDLAQRRMQLWRSVLEANLLKPADTFKIRAATPQDRGEITQVSLEITK